MPHRVVPTGVLEPSITGYEPPWNGCVTLGKVTLLTLGTLTFEVSLVVALPAAGGISCS